MSTCWGYYCKDCKVQSEDHWINHGEKELKECYEVAKFINDNGITSIEYYLEGYEWAKWEISEFLQEHHGHNVCLENEYGEQTEIQQMSNQATT